MMSETSNQKLLVAMTCAFGVVLVLIGYGRQRVQGVERLPIESKPAVATRAPTPISSPNQPIATGRVISRANRDSSQWQSSPAITRTPSNANSAPARDIPVQSSSYNSQASVEDYFSSSAPESQVPSRGTFSPPIRSKNRGKQLSITTANPPSRFTKNPPSRFTKNPPSEFAASETTKLADATGDAIS